ncbi:MAG: SurA N-terminal domain-containing protein [Anaerolineales bacterium]|jgi:parvulin-like peptidyl-prolyl isomerase
MAKNRPASRMSRKHLARAERERLQVRWIMTALIVTIVVVVGLLGYGIYDNLILQPKIVIATVNGERITKAQFQGRMRIVQRELAGQLSQYMQMESFFGSDPNVLQNIKDIETQLQTQLANPEALGRDVLNTLVREAAIRQEAEKRGISVSQAEIQHEIDLSFNFYPEGTPTPGPTSTQPPTATVDATAQAEATATATATAGPSPTPQPTGTAIPTPTEYTRQLFESDYKNFINSLSDWKIRESDYIAFIQARLLQDKLREDFDPEVERDQEQVQLQHILVDTVETAQEILDKLDQGADWDEMVSEYSVDVSTVSTGGEIGWRSLGEVISGFGQPAVILFSTDPGQYAGPIQTQDGWELFRVEAREIRPLSESAYQAAADQAFTNYLQQLQDEADVQISNDWSKHIINAPGYAS